MSIKVTDAELRAAAEKGSRDFVYVFMNKYAEAIGGELTNENMNLLTGPQHSLYSYKLMREKIDEGGFLLLIQEGYGPYIFDNPFAKAMRVFGAHRLSQLIYKAKKIYDANKEQLTDDIDTDEKYDAIMDKFLDKFEKIEDEIIVIEDDELDSVAHYVDEHLDDFAEIV